MKICPSCQREYPDEEEFCATDGMKLRPAGVTFTDPLVGAMLDGRWVIEEKIGEGGMGAVYRAHQQSVDRPVAVKTLRNEHIHDDEYVERFFREAQVAARISHPHCVTIHDFGQDPETGTLYLAMEYLEGTPLTDRISARDMTVAEVVQVGIQISSALAAAHETSVVHRDLKPDNVFLIDVAGGGTFVKVLDFGIAKLLEAETRMTKTGVVMGTPMYMSPEQCDGREIDLRSDLYSLGCILYEALCGRAPFFAETPMAVLLAHVSKPVIPPGELGVEVPDALAETVMKLLEKSPDDRHQSAVELRDALEQASTSLGDGARVVSTFAMNRDAWVFDETAAVPVSSVEARSPARDTVESGKGSGNGNRGLLAAIAALAVLVVFAGVGLGLALSDDDQKKVRGPASPASISNADTASKVTTKPEESDKPEEPEQVATDEANTEKVAEDLPKDKAREKGKSKASKKKKDKQAKKRAKKREERVEKARERLQKEREKRERTERERRERAEAEREKKKKETPGEKPSDPIAESIEERVEKERKKAEKSVEKEVDKIEKDTREALGDFGDLF